MGAFLEDIFKDVATSIVIYLGEWGYKQLTKDDSNDYIKELIKVISQTIDLYEKEYYIEETSKVPFYKSQILLDEFLKFRFTKQLDRQKVKQTVETDKRIIPPSKDEISNFFEIFDQQVYSSIKLKTLNIEVNFKEEIL